MAFRPLWKIQKSVAMSLAYPAITKTNVKHKGFREKLTNFVF